MNNIMFSIKRLFKNKNTVTIIGIVAIVAILYIGYNWQIKNITTPMLVPVAKVTIDQKTKITSDMIEMREVAPILVSNNVVTSRASLVGKYTNYNVVVPAGSLFYENEGILVTELPDFAFSNLKEGDKPFNFPVTLTSTYGNKIYPDSIIDIYMKATDTSGSVLVGRLLTNVRVLSVIDAAGRDVFESSLETRTPSTLIFGLDTETHLLMRKASYLDRFGVELFPVPRGGTLTTEQKNELVTEVSTSYLKEFINANTVSITEDDLLKAEQEQQTEEENNNGQTGE